MLSQSLASSTCQVCVSAGGTITVLYGNTSSDYIIGCEKQDVTALFTGCDVLYVSMASFALLSKALEVESLRI